MTKYPLATKKKHKSEVRPVDPWSGFFNFSYSITEVSAQGGRTHVKSRQTRFEDGKLTSEAFEGELDHGVYEGMVQQAQQVVADQTTMLLKSLSWFLPFSRR
jgi:hypothetical protein